MTREEAIAVFNSLEIEMTAILAEIPKSESEAKQIQRYIDAYDMAISAIRQKQTITKCNDLYDEDGGEILPKSKRNEPLTLDELRQMPIRDWVWIDVIHPKEAVSSYYIKYDGYKKDEIFWCGYPGLGFRFFYEDYGKTWLAYRQKPEEGTV